jgi:peptide/nickel transport system permease protein
MREYVVGRLAQMLLVVGLMSVIVFAIIRLIPGDPAVVLLGPEGASPEAVRALRQDLGLDQPLAVQYVRWLERVLRGDFGKSFMSKMPVSFLLKKSLPATLHLAAAALLIALVISIPTGILAAVRPRSWIDNLCTSFALAGVALPGFWLGIMLVLIFAVGLGWFPTSGYVPLDEDAAASARSVVLPALALGVSLAAALSRFLRTGMLDVLGQDYVRTARAKGLKERRVVFRHAVRNGLLSVVTVLGLQIGQLIGGSIVIEQVFNWPGIGRLILSAIQFRDYSIVQAVVLIVATGYVVINFVVDLLYVVLDPRIRYARGMA